MEAGERILTIVKEKGPILPVLIARETNESILMASARLSELLTSKQIKISNLKVGGSPLYYFHGQENKLQNFIDNLNEMEKRAYHFLLQNHVLRDSTQEPAIRVALRQIKDFAVPLQVNYKNKIELFWRWYLIDNKEAEIPIKDILSKKEEVLNEKISKKPDVKLFKETQKQEIKKEIPEELRKDETKKSNKIVDKNLFLKEVYNFFNKSKISIIEAYHTKRSYEIDFIIEIQTSIGNIKYFCRSKNKKKTNEADISSAVIQSQSKNLPLLFLTNGILTKKAREMFKNEFKNITFKKI